MRKVNFLFFAAIFFMLLSSSCKQKPQFGKAPLHLDNFALNLDVETFFADETLFRNNEDYSVKAEEEIIKIDGTDSTLRYVRYSVVSSPVGDTLARYNDFYFGDLEVIMDYDDKETFMVSASQDKVRPGGVDSLIRDISNEYGHFITVDKPNESREVAYNWKKGDKLVRLVLNVENPLYYDYDNEKQYNIDKLFSEAYHKAEDISVAFFITKPKFDYFLKKASSYSGLLTRYR